MTKQRLLAIAFPLLVVILLVDLGTAAADRPAVKFTDARLKVEINATDGDAGLQIFLDGQAWREVQLFNPQGTKILDVAAAGTAADFGFTELFSESNEPPFVVFPIEQFKALFPAGVYSFRGTTIDGRTMTGEATLTHNFPDGPEIVQPAEGAKLPRDQVVVDWKPVTTPSGIQIGGYQVLVEQENPLRVFSVDLPATARRLPIPAEFLEPARYKVEVLAIEVGGNQTLTELSFTVR